MSDRYDITGPDHDGDIEVDLTPCQDDSFIYFNRDEVEEMLALLDGGEEKEEQVSDDMTFLNKLLIYQHNTSPRFIFEDVYGVLARPTDYIAEKCEQIRLHFLLWAGSLDAEHQQRLVDAINSYSGARD